MRNFQSLFTAASVLALCASAAIVPKTASPAGAAYFINNEPSGNKVVVLAIDTSGKATFSKAVSAAGAGLTANPTGADSTFSQDAVHVSGKHLFVVNPGSNTVAMFSINQQDPTDIQMIGVPAPSMGDFPMSLASHPKLPITCVLNGGTRDGVACYITSSVYGLLPIESSFRSLSQVVETQPPTGPPGTFADILFSADGKHLFVSLKGSPPIPGTVFVYNVDQHGLLSQNATMNTGGPVPFSMTNIPGKQAILMADASGAVATFDFSRGSFANQTVALTPVPGAVATCWSEFSTKTGNFYISDAATSAVTEVHLDSTLKATIVASYPLAPLSATLDNSVATIGGKDYLYVLQANATSVSVLALNAPGKASVMQTLDLAGSPVTLGPNMIGLATVTK